MEKMKVLKTKFSCQQTKDVIIGCKREYTEFVARCLDDEEFVKTMNKLLPFDKVAQAKLRIVDDASPVKSMGLSIMRMELDPPLFSLGISIEIAGSEGNEGNEATNYTIFIAACRTLEELREYVKSDAFSIQVRENFEKQIEDSFSVQDKLLQRR
jgi:hypothetical protein